MWITLFLGQKAVKPKKKTYKQNAKDAIWARVMHSINKIGLTIGSTRTQLRRTNMWSLRSLPHIGTPQLVRCAGR